jgi:hypothetical protein
VINEKGGFGYVWFGGKCLCKTGYPGLWPNDQPSSAFSLAVHNHIFENISASQFCLTVNTSTLLATSSDTEDNRRRSICSIGFPNSARPSLLLEIMFTIVYQNFLYHYDHKPIYSGYLKDLSLKSVKSANSSFSKCSWTIPSEIIVSRQHTRFGHEDIL